MKVKHNQSNTTNSPHMAWIQILMMQVRVLYKLRRNSIILMQQKMMIVKLLIMLKNGNSLAKMKILQWLKKQLENPRSCSVNLYHFKMEKVSGELAKMLSASTWLKQLASNDKNSYTHPILSVNFILYI